MADIAATDVVYTINQATNKVISGRREAIFSIVFGNGALTYPTGGVPLTAAKLGCPNNIEEFLFMDAANANGFLYKYDATNNKIRIYQGDNDNAADAPGIELIGGSATPAAATLKAKVVGW